MGKPTEQQITCPWCGGYGFQVHYVSHEMALDACEPQMEGQEVHEQCGRCNGDGWLLKDESEE